MYEVKLVALQLLQRQTFLVRQCFIDEITCMLQYFRLVTSPVIIHQAICQQKVDDGAIEIDMSKKTVLRIVYFSITGVV